MGDLAKLDEILFDLVESYLKLARPRFMKKHYLNRESGNFKEIQKAKAALTQLLLEARIDELTEALQMNGVHPGDWEVAIHQRIAELKALGTNQ